MLPTAALLLAFASGALAGAAALLLTLWLYTRRGTFTTPPPVRFTTRLRSTRHLPPCSH